LAVSIGPTWADAALALTFGIWLLLTVATQHKSRLADRVRSTDLSLLIPRWHFFAPNPGVHDFVLVFRDRNVGGAVSPWRQAPTPSTSNPALWVVWNPARRHTKALIDIANELIVLINEHAYGRAQLVLAVPYLTLLNHVSSLPRLDVDVSTQFAIAIAQSAAVSGEPDVVFVSALHRLG
jgi:hypothetical protein